MSHSARHAVRLHKVYIALAETEIKHVPDRGDST